MTKKPFDIAAYFAENNAAPKNSTLDHAVERMRQLLVMPGRPQQPVPAKRRPPVDDERMAAILEAMAKAALAADGEPAKESDLRKAARARGGAFTDAEWRRAYGGLSRRLKRGRGDRSRLK